MSKISRPKEGPRSMFGLTRQVSSQHADLELVRHHFNTLGPSTLIPVEYLEDAVAVRFSSSTGQLMAQYLIKRGPKLRYYGFIPDESKPSSPPEHEVCELTAFWMDAGLGRWARFAVYIWMQIDLYRLADRPWIVVGTERPSLRKRNQLAFYREIWVGPHKTTGVTWYIDGIRRREYLRRLVLGVPRMALLQLRNRRRPGYGGISPS